MKHFFWLIFLNALLFSCCNDKFEANPLFTAKFNSFYHIDALKFKTDNGKTEYIINDTVKRELHGCKLDMGRAEPYQVWELFVKTISSSNHHNTSNIENKKPLITYRFDARSDELVLNLYDFSSTLFSEKKSSNTRDTLYNQKLNALLEYIVLSEEQGIESFKKNNLVYRKY